MATWLVLDVSYLCYRNHYAMGRLSHNDISTTIIYGLLRDIQFLTERFSTQRLVFAFDHGRDLREQACPTYKQSRRRPKKDMTEEQQDALLETRTQIQMLRREYLPALGYANVLSAPGYEADDIIASVCLNLPKGDDAVVVSADHDLYQLLNHKVRIYNPAKHDLLDAKGFTKEWGIDPIQWYSVKAIAGCTSDDVPGIQGVGEKTAVKFLTGRLGKGSIAERSIIDGEAIWKANLPLVKLPYPGTPVFPLHEDSVSPKAWQALMEKMGIKSLRMPGVGPTMSVGKIKEGFGF